MKTQLHRNSIVVLRKKLSLSQRDLANYLGISGSLLAMFERGVRSLPTVVLVKLSQLETGFLKNEKNNTRPLAEAAIQKDLTAQDAKAAAKMFRKAVDQRTKGLLQQHRLKTISEKLEKDMVWLAVIEEQLAVLPKDKTHKGDRLWLEIQQDKVLQRLSKGNKKQAELLLQTELLLAAAGVYEMQHAILKKGNLD